MSSDKPAEVPRPSDRKERDDQERAKERERERAPKRDDERSKLSNDDRDSPGAERKEKGTRLPDRGEGGASGGGGGSGTIRGEEGKGPKPKTAEEMMKEDLERDQARRQSVNEEQQAILRRMARSGR